MDSYVVKVQNKGTIRRLTLALGEKQFSYEQLQSRIGSLFQLPASAQFVLTYTDKDGDVVTMAEDEDLKDALVLQKLNPLRVTIENVQVGTDDVKVSSPLVQKEWKSDEVTEKQQEQPQQSVQGEQIPQALSKALDVDPVATVEPGENSTDASPASAAAVDTANKTSPEGATATGNRFSVRMEAKRNDGGRQFHSGIRCDGCGMLPIQGPRFKSCKKPNYDLCLNCFEASGAEENEYAKVDRLFSRIGYPAYVGRMRELQRANERMCKPDQGPDSTPNLDVKDSTSAAEAGNKTAGEENSTGALHQGVQCDECGMVPIQGPRYKSTTRFNYDVCHGCFEKSGSNASEYTCIEKPHVNARAHPLVMRGPMRRGPPCLRQCPGRWVWVLNQMVPGLAVDEAGAGERAPAAGSDVKVGGDAVTPPQAEAAATENTSTSAPTTKTDSAPLFAKPADETVEVQTPEDVEKSESSTGSDAVNNAGKTAGVQEEIAQATAWTADGKAAGVEGETVQAPAVAADRDLSTKEGLLGKLAAMGFEDPKLNEELLGKNNFELRRTLDDLCAAEEWDPILGELQEMGFYDANMNRRLMFKNNGSVKRVVKELVQMYKGEKLA